MDNFNATLPELNEDELAALVMQARRKKAQQEADKAYFERLKAKPIMPTAEQLDSWILNEAKRQDPNNSRYLGPEGYVLDDTNRHIFNALSLYFTNDPRFEQLPETRLQFKGAKFLLKKGLALFGPVGCGKTTLLRLFSSNPRESFTVVRCKVAAHNYTTDGDPMFDYYCGKSSVYGSAFQHTSGGRGFDDLGVEPIPVSHFKNSRNIMADLLDSRYELGPAVCGLTHLTTNLSTDQIEEFYGQRIRSRMREMFNTIYFDPQTPDRR